MLASLRCVGRMVGLSGPPVARMSANGEGVIGGEDASRGRYPVWLGKHHLASELGAHRLWVPVVENASLAGQESRPRRLSASRPVAWPWPANSPAVPGDAVRRLADKQHEQRAEMLALGIKVYFATESSEGWLDPSMWYSECLSSPISAVIAARGRRGLPAGQPWTRTRQAGARGPSAPTQ
jgi:hypothetical protein